MKFSLAIALPALFAVKTAAHGIIANARIGNGRSFSVNDGDSIIRKVSSQDPNYGASNPALTCGPNAQAAPNSANANPGDVMSFKWTTASGGNWPHNTGPIITYMASCGNSDCKNANAAQLSWFKIEEKGRKNGNGDWFQADIMAGGEATATIPQNLAPGNYMVRHEIIALHLASNQGGAEFYPGCVQLKVGGSGTGAPSANELVKFPGGYSDTDPGIHVNAFSGAPYDFPGPAVSSLAATGSPSSGAPASGSSSASAPASSNTGKPPGNAAAGPSSAAASPQTTSASGSGKSNSGHCGGRMNKKRNVRRQTPVDADIVDELPEITVLKGAVKDIKSRHINSRVARRMAFEASLQ